MHCKYTALPLLALVLSTPAPAQDRGDRSSPVAVAIAQTVPDAVDTPYPGVIELNVDATDTVRRAFRVTETIPVKPGATNLTLLLPEWLPGKHGPRGALAEVADVFFLVDGKKVDWVRDPVEVYAFHVSLPAGAREVVAKFIYTSPFQPSEGRVVMTPEMMNIQFEQMSLYPAGHYVRRIRVKPTVTFPAGWTATTALDGQSAPGGTVNWAETDYETLIDSPIFAGAHYATYDLGHDVDLDIVADEAKDLATTPEQIARHRALVDQAVRLFGARHFDHYDFLLALTDTMGGIGLEHHRSSENQLDPDAFTEWDDQAWDRGLLPHEFVHSWNGKFRRPAGLWTPDYRQPMQDNLLWVYEGQTQFWGIILAARSGMQPKDIVLGQLATYAGGYTQQPGREWRSVEDTTLDPVFAARKAKPFSSLTRNEDYYTEGALVWLEADQIIRQGTSNTRGLDDFARAFFGIRDGDWGEVTYTFDQVAAALNDIYPYDWARFLDTRLRQPGQPAPLKGLEMAGYRLVWKDEPNPYDAARMKAGKYLNLNHAIGVVIGSDGKVSNTRWGSAAFDAGIVTGTQIMAVNGTAYSDDRLKDAIAAAKDGKAPLELLVQRGDSFLTVPVAYDGGLRWPWLEKSGRGDMGLDKLLEPRGK